MPVLARDELEASPLADLHTIASELGIEGFRRLRKSDLIDTILEHAPSGSANGAPAEARDEEDEPRPARRRTRRPATADDEGDAPAPRSRRRAGAADEEDARPARRSRRGGRRSREPDAEVEDAGEDAPARRDEEEGETRTGVLDILPNGSGFLRAAAGAQSGDDAYVSPAQIRRCELRSGDEVSGQVRSPRRSERHPSLVRVDTVNGAPAEAPADRPRFHDLTPVFATASLAVPPGLEETPLGRGSRVAVGGAAGSGATTVLREIVATLRERHPEVELTVVLAGVRPEEVTEWRRATEVPVAGGGFDRPADEQAQIAEAAAERAKRVVERGGDAALVIDSLDALPPGSARTLFGAARNTEEAGSLTVIAATGLAGELQRLATTRIVLDLASAREGRWGLIAAASGTTHAELLR